MDAAPNVEALLEHADWVRALARSLVADPSAAEDVVQEAWLAALRSPPSEAGNPRGWLGAVVRNAARKLGRGATRRAIREEHAAQSEALPSTAELVEQASLQRELVGHVLDLGEPYRSTVLLRFFQDLEASEIAARTGVPLNTVRTRLQRGLERLREKLDREHGDRRSWCLAFAALARAPIASTAAVHGSLLTTLGAWIMALNLKWIAAVSIAALAIGWWWTAIEERSPDAPIAVSQAAEPPGAPVAENAGVASASAESGTRQSLEPSDSPHAAEEQPAAPRETIRGRCFDVEGRALGGLELEWIDAREPRVEGELAWFGNHGIEVTSARRERWKRNPRSLERLVATYATFLHVREVLLGEPVPRPRAVTAADGSFEFELESGDGDIDLVRKDLVFLGDGVLHGESTAYCVVGPAIRIGGEVVDGDGAPIHGASLSLRVSLGSFPDLPVSLEARSNHSWDADSDERGRFVMERVPSVAGQELVVQERGYKSARLALPDRSRDDLRIVLPEEQRGPRQIVTGRVVDRTGLGIPGASVQLGEAGGVLSDEAGYFEMELSFTPGPTAALTAIKRGFRPAVLAAFGTELAERPESAQDAVLVLDEPLPPIRGRVLEADGRPGVGWRVDLAGATHLGSSSLTIEVQASWNPETHGQATFELAGMLDTDGQGNFELGGLLDHDYRVRAWQKETLLVLESEPVRPGAKDVLLRVPEDAYFERVTGRVISKRGLPVGGARVAFGFALVEGEGLPGLLNWGPSVEADAQGRFQLERVPRRYCRVGVLGEWFSSGADRPWVELAADADRREIVLEVNVDVRVQLELAETEPANRFALLDRQGKALALRFHSRGFVSMGVQELHHEGESFPLLDVSEEAETLVLYRDDAELRRIPLALRPGELNVIAP